MNAGFAPLGLPDRMVCVRVERTPLFRLRHPPSGPVRRVRVAQVVTRPSRCLLQLEKLSLYCMQRDQGVART